MPRQSEVNLQASKKRRPYKPSSFCPSHASIPSSNLAINQSTSINLAITPPQNPKFQVPQPPETTSLPLYLPSHTSSLHIIISLTSSLVSQDGYQAKPDPKLNSTTRSRPIFWRHFQAPAGLHLLLVPATHHCRLDPVLAVFVVRPRPVPGLCGVYRGLKGVERE